MVEKYCTNCARFLIDGGVSTGYTPDVGSFSLIFRVFQLINVELGKGSLCKACYNIILDIESLQKEFKRLGGEPRDVYEYNKIHDPRIIEEDESFDFDPLDRSFNQSQNVDENENDPGFEDVKIQCY